MSEQTKDLRATMTSLRQLSGVPASFRLAGLFLLRTENGSIRFNLPDGRSVLFDHGNPGPRAVVDVHEFGFAKRALAGGDIGFAESYMDGEWSTPDLTAVLEFFSENFEAAGKLAVGGSLVKGINKVRHFFNRNSKAGARRNIMAHYDLGNDFYGQWLDPSMTYSSAVFTSGDQSLEEAQLAKYHRVADMAGISEGASVLEIGCGWGGFAETVARDYKANLRGITLSAEQLKFGLERLKRQGLDQYATLVFEDYRHTQGQFDHIGSIEMIEAVGEDNWPSYFQTLHDRLKPGGTAAIQAITINEADFDGYRAGPDFIQRYIFPGGMLLTKTVMKEFGTRYGLVLEQVETFGQSYARTLRLWRERFLERWPMIAPLGYDETFKRKWVYYLSYCEAGFTEGAIDVGIYQYRRPAEPAA